MFLCSILPSCSLKQMFCVVFLYRQLWTELFSYHPVNELQEHDGSDCWTAVDSKQVGFELNVAKASCNASAERGRSWSHFSADLLVLCLVSCLWAFVYSSSSFRPSTSLTLPTAPRSSYPLTLQACSRLASHPWQVLALVCWLWALLGARPTCL